MEAEAFNATASFALQKTGEETEMNYNERKFNMDIAAVCGLREAVIVDFIRDWLLTSDETTYRHGHLWVKCTQKTMTVHLPFLTEIIPTGIPLQLTARSYSKTEYALNEGNTE